MKHIYLLRHAHADDATPARMTDHERTLSPRGEAEARSIAARMESEGFVPDFVLSSSSVRTLQTARAIFGEKLREAGEKIESDFNRALYLAGPDEMTAQIRGIGRTFENVLVIGHNPGLGEFSARCGHDGAGYVDFSPATMAVYACDIDDWRDFDPAKAALVKSLAP